MLKWTSVAFRLTIAAVLVLFGFGLIAFMASTREKPALKPEALTRLLVKGVVLQPQPVSREWEGYGTARAMNESNVSPQVAARVVERPNWLEVGAIVEKGQTLFKLNPEDFQFAARSAQETIGSLQAQLTGLDVEQDRLQRQVQLATEEQQIAERTLNRAKEAVGRGAGTQSELDQRTASLRQAERTVASLRQQLDMIPSRRTDLERRIAAQQVALEQAEQNLARTEIHAPIAGRIASVELEEGEWAQPGQVAATIVNLARIEVPLRISIEAAGQVAIGDRVELRSRQGAARTWTGHVARISPQADATTRSLGVYAEVTQDPADNDVLRPGQFVIGRVIEADQPLRLIVPRRAIREGRIFIAAPSESREAAVWPLAQRIAASISREISSQVRATDSGSISGAVHNAVELEVGDAADELAAQLSPRVQSWLANAGTQRVQNEVRKALTTALEADVANWLVRIDPAHMPSALQRELETTSRLSVVQAVPVESVFSIERVFETIDPRENQWVIVRPLNDISLAGRTLLVSNLEQLVDGKMIDVALQAQTPEGPP